METIKFYKSIRQRVLFVFMAMFLLGSCATKATFPVSNVVPATDGYVKVKQGKNDNYEIKVKVKHLAPAERLNPPKDVYVVWIETASGVENIGQLNTSSSLVSDTRKGSLETVSSYKPDEVFITAESSPKAQYPGMQEVLRTEIED